MKQWHYADQESRPKQISEAEIHAFVKSGEIGPQTRIWTDGMKDWAPAGDLMQQLFQNTANGTPPPPLPSGGAPPHCRSKVPRNRL